MVIITEYFMGDKLVMAIDFGMGEFPDSRMRLNESVSTQHRVNVKAYYSPLQNASKPEKFPPNKIAFIDTTCSKKYFSPNGMRIC